MGDIESAKILDEDEEFNDAYRDGLENLVSGLGTERDKRSHTKFVNTGELTGAGAQQELNALYRTDSIAGKIVDIVPGDMTREWRVFDGGIDPEVVELLVQEEEDLQLSFKFNLAGQWARLYGTSLIVMSIDDGNTPDKPLEIDKIKEGGLKHIQVVDRHQISPDEVEPIADPLNPNYGMPEYYRFVNTSVKIHHSRVLRFDGTILPFDEFRRNNYFSDSVLTRLYSALVNFNTTADGTASMVYEANVDIVKVKGLMTYMATPEGENLIRKRFSLAKVLKSFNNMMLLDSEEDFDSKSSTFTGLPDLLDRFSTILSSASDIPVTRLFGTSAKGMNATGEGDLKNYYDKILAMQKRDYKPKLDYFDKIMATSLGLPEDTDISYKFSPLYQMTPKEIAEIQFIDAQRDAIYLDRDVVPTSTVTKELEQEKTYTNIDEDYIEELEEFENDDVNALTKKDEPSAEQDIEDPEQKEGSPDKDEQIFGD